MKVRNIRCSQMLCESTTSVGEVTRGDRYFDSNYDYIEEGYGDSDDPD